MESKRVEWKWVEWGWVKMILMIDNYDFFMFNLV